MTGRSSSLQNSTQSATGADCSLASLLQYLLSLHTSPARQAHDVLPSSTVACSCYHRSTNHWDWCGCQQHCADMLCNAELSWITDVGAGAGPRITRSGSQQRSPIQSSSGAGTSHMCWWRARSCPGTTSASGAMVGTRSAPQRAFPSNSKQRRYGPCRWYSNMCIATTEPHA